MAEDPFVPLGKSGDPQAADEWRQALHEGFPQWLWPSVHDWIRAQYPNAAAALAQIRKLERKLRVELLPNSDFPLQGVQKLVQLSREDDAFCLDVLDYLVSQTSGSPAYELRDLLEEAGSTWRVAQGNSQSWALERRVDPTLTQLVEVEVSGGGRASVHLAAAWSAVFGRGPSPSHAFREAVKAVEAVTIPVVLPRDGTATLGKVIGEISANPNDYVVRLQPKPLLQAVEAFTNMLRTLWTSQYDRHATADATAPFEVSLPEAEDAVTLAVTIVHWLNTGAFARAD